MGRSHKRDSWYDEYESSEKLERRQRDKNRGEVRNNRRRSNKKFWFEEEETERKS